MSKITVDTVEPATGTSLTLGANGDTITVPVGATLTNSGTATGFGLFSAYAIIADQKSSGTDGGTATSGSWQTRHLNTEIADPSGIVSISSNQFTLAAGNYLITWSAPAGDVLGHQSRLYDVTGTAEVGVGTSEYSYTDYDGETRSMGSLRVTPSGSNVYRIEHRVNTTKADRGFGTGTGWGVEQYTMVEIYKES